VSHLTDQVESLECALEDYRHELYDKKATIEQLEEELSQARDELYFNQLYIDWFEATYPEAKTAYEVAQRVST
jgi:chromosome segregation ATPase